MLRRHHLRLPTTDPVPIPVLEPSSNNDNKAEDTASSSNSEYSIIESSQVNTHIILPSSVFFHDLVRFISIYYMMSEDQQLMDKLPHLGSHVLPNTFSRHALYIYNTNSDMYNNQHMSFIGDKLFITTSALVRHYDKLVWITTIKEYFNDCISITCSSTFDNLDQRKTKTIDHALSSLINFGSLSTDIVSKMSHEVTFPLHLVFNNNGLAYDHQGRFQVNCSFDFDITFKPSYSVKLKRATLPPPVCAIPVHVPSTISHFELLPITSVIPSSVEYQHYSFNRCDNSLWLDVATRLFPGHIIGTQEEYGHGYSFTFDVNNVLVHIFANTGIAFAPDALRQDNPRYTCMIESDSSLPDRYPLPTFHLSSLDGSSIGPFEFDNVKMPSNSSVGDIILNQFYCKLMHMLADYNITKFMMYVSIMIEDDIFPIRIKVNQIHDITLVPALPISPIPSQSTHFDRLNRNGNLNDSPVLKRNLLVIHSSSNELRDFVNSVKHYLSIYDNVVYSTIEGGELNNALLKLFAHDTQEHHIMIITHGEKDKYLSRNETLSRDAFFLLLNDHHKALHPDSTLYVFDSSCHGAIDHDISLPNISNTKYVIPDVISSSITKGKIIVVTFNAVITGSHLLSFSNPMFVRYHDVLMTPIFEFVSLRTMTALVSSTDPISYIRESDTLQALLEYQSFVGNNLHNLVHRHIHTHVIVHFPTISYK